MSVGGSERREKLSRHSCSLSKRHLWLGCPWNGALGAELGLQGTLGSGAEQICPGPPAGSVLCGLQAPGWRPLYLRHAEAIPKHALAQPGKQCQPAGSVLPTDFACSSYFPLLSLAPVKEPGPGFVCLNPPCAKLLPLCGIPGFGGSSVRAALMSLSHQLSLGDMLPVRTEARIPLATSHRVRFFPSLPSEIPSSWTAPCCHWVPLPSSGLSLVTSTGPLRTRGSLANVTAGHAGAGTGLPQDSASPCSVGMCPCIAQFPESCSMEEASRSLSVISFGSQPDPGWAVSGQPPLTPFDLLPIILDASF